MPRKSNTGTTTPANQQKGKKVCSCCHNEKNLTEFYLSYSPMYSLDKRIPVCKDCCKTSVLNEDGTIDYGKLIIAPFTYPLVCVLIDSLGKALLDDDNFSIKCYNNKFVDNKRTDEIEEQAEVKVVRSQEGVLHIGVKKNGSCYYFPLFPDLKWHKFYDKDGKEITDKRKLSNMMVRAYVNLLKGAFINTITDIE